MRDVVFVGITLAAFGLVGLVLAGIERL